MVHALEQVNNLLKPDGYLIDIHPNGELVEFYYELNGHEHFLGYMQESDDYIEYQQASEAIQTVLERVLFKREATGEFEFRTYANTFLELITFLEENWSDAVITEDVVIRSNELETEWGEYETVLREQVNVNLLKRVRQNSRF